jgi:hypothetical protein
LTAVFFRKTTQNRMFNPPLATTQAPLATTKGAFLCAKKCKKFQSLKVSDYSDYTTTILYYILLQKKIV